MNDNPRIDDLTNDDLQRGASLLSAFAEAHNRRNGDPKDLQATREATREDVLDWMRRPPGLHDPNDALLTLAQSIASGDSTHDSSDTLRTAIAHCLSPAFEAELTPLPVNADPGPREMVVEGLIPAGRLSGLYGTGAAGKSRLSLQLAGAITAAAASGHDVPMLLTDPEAHSGTVRVPDVRACGNGRVLLVTWEDERCELVRRWRAADAAGALPAGADPDRLRMLDMRSIGGPLWGPAPGGSGHTSTLGDWTTAGRRLLSTLQGFTLCLVDPVAAAYGSDENSRSLVRQFCSALDRAAEEAGCAVVLVGHRPKGQGGNAAAYSGSTDWHAAVRCMLTLGTEMTDYGDNRRKVKKGGGKEEPAPIYAPCLTREKVSYAAIADCVWLRSEFEPAEPARIGRTGSPMRLAWKATSAYGAAVAVAGHSDIVSLEAPAKNGKERPPEVA